MIPIHIDLSEVVEEFALTGDQAQELGAEIINRVVVEYTNKWENLVNKGLRQTRKLYKKAMYVDRISPTEVVLDYNRVMMDWLCLLKKESLLLTKR